MDRETRIFACLMCALLFACDGDSTADPAPTPDTGAADAGGMVDAADVDAAPPLALSPDLCDDPENLQRLGDMLGPAGDPPYGMLDPATVSEMASAPTEGPFYMINLIRYRERAEYADGRETDLTGREAEALYAVDEFLQAIGARVVFVGDVGEALLGEEGAWHRMAIVEYPCPIAFFAMAADPAFQARAIHKDAGVERSIVMVSTLQDSILPAGFTPAESPFPATPDDPAIKVVHVLKYNDIARYAEGVDEPERTGREAMALYTAGAQEAALRLGVYPSAWFDVQGVLIGDGRDWDEVRLNHMPSGAAFEALLADESRLAGVYHREASYIDTYAMVTHPLLYSIPGGPDGDDPPVQPVTEDGTGTPCQADADCAGLGPSLCLNPQGAGGFCTREGCDAGTCQAPYLCCRECAEAFAAQLPFMGSACIPEAGAETLQRAPLSCTCD